MWGQPLLAPGAQLGRKTTSVRLLLLLQLLLFSWPSLWPRALWFPRDRGSPTSFVHADGRTHGRSPTPRPLLSLLKVLPTAVAADHTRTKAACGPFHAGQEHSDSPPVEFDHKFKESRLLSAVALCACARCTRAHACGAQGNPNQPQDVCGKDFGSAAVLEGFGMPRATPDVKTWASCRVQHGGS